MFRALLRGGTSSSAAATWAGFALMAVSVQTMNGMVSSSSTTARTEEKTSDSAVAPPPLSSSEPPQPQVRRYAAAFLNAEGKSTLAETFKPVHSNAISRPHMTVSYDPKGASLARLATQLGRPVDLKVNAIVTDKHAQTAIVELVKATEDDDGGVPFLVENATPHVTISLAEGGHDGYGPFYSNHLLSRAIAEAGGFNKNWKGVLPARDGYEATECEITIPEQRIVLTATLCVSDQWNDEANRCGEEKGCGFCRFMKLGPCGTQFAAWEACIDKCKETEDDFVDKCAQQTLILKQCVDMNPDYYYSVLEEETEEGEEQPEAEAAAIVEEQAVVLPDALPTESASTSGRGEIEPTIGAAVSETEQKQLAEAVLAAVEEAMPNQEQGQFTSASEEGDAKVTSQETDADFISVDGTAVVDSAVVAEILNAADGGESSSSTTEMEEENYTTKG